MDNGQGLRIGVFSQLTGISVRMLRHYGTHGVLIPAATDPATGYRFHSSDQIPEALPVTRLRDAGFPVRDIHTVLDSRRNTATLTALSRERRRAILGGIAAAEAQLLALDALDCGWSPTRFRSPGPCSRPWTSSACARCSPTTTTNISCGKGSAS
ncbi:MerR family DNA-binding transcriptional regulator [Corynebacterium sp. TAE3-ERU16]|uniref:MerR family DNA-binding transcriptional regulator n=1 Tax=Corynebacterium sp. TAE3-ERU16 TaxID=2849493 RepID=UPI002106853A|nr:MerR family DNA-binding transcriptional regulator [Corynebacterium sp. TAE3-ERU16]